MAGEAALEAAWEVGQWGEGSGLRWLGEDEGGRGGSMD